VQHDGNRWRCLVACPLAAIAGRPFSANWPRQIDRLAVNKTQVLWGRRRGVLFRARMHGRMSRQHERQGSANHSTIALLAQTSSSPTMTWLLSILTQYIGK
jgi:hypothetical protein